MQSARYLRDWRARCLLAVLCALGPAALAFADDATPAAVVDFERDIEPIFATHCDHCHGERFAENGLRLTLRASALAGGDSGAAAVVPGRPDESRLIQLVRAKGELRMPPADEGDALSSDEIALLVRWIEAGAPWPDARAQRTTDATHWAWVAPVRPPLPEARFDGWSANPIDRFIGDRLAREGLAPVPRAERAVLARRAALDLIGLPPSAEMLASLLGDPAPDAFERYVDQLLANPGFGEHWGRMWLDLARYADSKGYGSDPLRTIWRYRDWVIEAFNRNLPYDRFTIEQLAGDLLPEPTDETLLATAFHRNTMANDEGGTDDEEFRVAAIKDRVDTTMQVWMGLTFGCAKCHSHKYDPLTQREYYSLYAFFNQTADADRGDEQPLANLPTHTQAVELAHARATLAAAERALDEAVSAEGQIAWERAARWSLAVVPLPLGSQELLADLATAPAERAADAASRVAVNYRELDPALAPYRHARDDVKARLATLEASVAPTPIMRELPTDQQRTTRVLRKGNYLLPGAEVTAATPAAFHGWIEAAPRNRLGLAQWLVDRRNPLTARVAVNRFWARLFGRGLVLTEEDFGTQGQAPSHVELLDWLAVEFAETWDVKQLLRRLVTSAAYRQSSIVAPERRKRDPENVLISRGPSGRLDAEVVRDQALAIAGLLSRKIGGPSVYPPQPEGLWRAAFNGQRTWPTSTGEDRYRRALYTYWRRSVPYPSLAAFDAPSREICTFRRVSTNTPLQAFVTLNDPAYVEIAQALARRILREAEPDTARRAAYAIRLALGRPASAEQVAVLARLVDAQRGEFAANLVAAEKVATVPLGPAPAGEDVSELAAWTVAAGVVLNLDGVLSKR